MFNIDNEYSKCNFCRQYDIHCGCRTLFCRDYSEFHPNNEKIIEKAKEKELSVSDVIALISIN